MDEGDGTILDLPLEPRGEAWLSPHLVRPLLISHKCSSLHATFWLSGAIPNNQFLLLRESESLSKLIA